MKIVYAIPCPGGAAQVDLMDLNPTLHLITRVIVPVESRRRGYGSQLMEQVCEDADDDGVTLTLEPQPYTNSMSVDQLIAWYAKFGFHPDNVNIGALAREPRPAEEGQ